MILMSMLFQIIIIIAWCDSQGYPKNSVISASEENLFLTSGHTIGSFMILLELNQADSGLM